MAWLQLFALLAGASSFKLYTNHSATDSQESAGTWKLVLKVGKTKTLGFSNPLWTNSALLNEGSAVATEEDAKYSAFNTEPFKKVRMCVGSPESNCVEHIFSKKYDNAKALFSAGYIRDETVKRDEILSTFGPAKGSYQDCPMQRPGFNIECHDGNKARWGFCLNCASQGCQNDDGNDADAAIGIGIAGQSTDTELGGGWSAYFASGKGTCSANSKTFKAVWFWVDSLKKPSPKGDYKVLPGKKCKGTPYTFDTASKCDGFQGLSVEQCQDKCFESAKAPNCPQKTCGAAVSYKSGWCHLYEECPEQYDRSEATAILGKERQGNWKLALKVGKTATLGFSNPLWTNSDLLNEASAPATEEDAKYDAFNTEPFKRLRMCIGSPESNCVEHVFSKKYNNAKALFSAGYIRDGTVKRDEILSKFGPAKGSYQDCPMQRPGFNIECKDGNKARWGFCLNCASQGCQNSDSNDADAAIGIGIAGQSTDTELGGGWTAYFASGKGTCSANSKTFKSVWLWVDSLKQEDHWELALKVGKTATLGFSSPLWTTDDLLNSGSPVATEEDAKYDAFNTVPFKKVRMCIGSPESNCVEHVFSKKYNNAKALFSAGYIRDKTVKRDEILSKFGPAKGSYQDCPMQRPGFNIECKDGNKARWGFCLNCASQGCQNSDSNDADAAIGIGIAGQSTDTELGGGWTAYFASGKGTCSANSKTFKSVWFWVASLEGSSRPYTLTKDEWTPVMKIAETTTLGFSSAYWTNDELLKPDSSIEAEEDAKYQAYLDKELKSIRMCIGRVDTNCVKHTFKKKYKSAKELFTSGYIRDADVDRDGILATFGPAAGSFQDCPMQRPGFNIECKDGNKARWGFCLNCASQGCQNSDSNDADAAIGIGIAGQSTDTELGGGWTAYFASGKGTCSANSKTFKSAWLWVSSGKTSKPAQDVALAGDFASFSHGDTDKFLKECSAALAPAKCLKVVPRALKFLVTVTAPDEKTLEGTVSKVFNAGIGLKSLGHVEPQLLECEGTLASGGSAKHWACDGQPLDKCDATYTQTSTGEYYQCGVSGRNCLGTGPACTAPR